MPNPAATSDVTDRWLFDHAVPDEGKVQTKLDEAWRHLLSRDRTIETRLTAGTLSPEDVIDVVCAMALRVMGNPSGKRQEAIDDYSWTRDAAVSAGEMYVTDAELKQLRPTSTTANRSSVRLVVYGEL